MDYAKIVGAFITPWSAVFVAFITTCGALVLKRQFSLADRRTKQDERCERYENAYRVLTFWVRQHMQTILTIDTLRQDAAFGDVYALGRLRELAQEETPLEPLERYVEGVAELPLGDEKAGLSD